MRHLCKQKYLLCQAKAFCFFQFFGVIFTLIVFLVGWALLSYLSHITAGITKAYKHISNMRYLKSKLFEGNEFAEYTIMPISADAVPVRYSSHLPIIFSIINGASLLMMLYFLELQMDLFWSFFITTLVLALFGIYYPTACTNFYKHLKVAEKIKPGQSEIVITAAIERLLSSQKKKDPYKTQKRVMMMFMINFLILKIWHTVFYFRENKLSYPLLLLESTALLMMFIFRYLMEAYKITEQHYVKEEQT